MRKGENGLINLKSTDHLVRSGELHICKSTHGFNGGTQLMWINFFNSPRLKICTITLFLRNFKDVQRLYTGLHQYTGYSINLEGVASPY